MPAVTDTFFNSCLLSAVTTKPFFSFSTDVNFPFSVVDSVYSVTLTASPFPAAEISEPDTVARVSPEIVFTATVAPTPTEATPEDAERLSPPP